MFSLWLKALLLLSTLCFAAPRFDGKFESIEMVQGDEVTLFEHYLKLVGRQRLVNGTIVYHVDLNEDYDVLIDVWTWKNGKWARMNINWRQKPCFSMKNFYAKYLEPSLQDSNLPTGNDLCPLRKGEYYLKNVELNTDNLPTLLSPGMKKCRVALMKEGKVFGGFTVVISLVDRGT
ncbi:uncharacterized protein LOC111079082 [Drosophila obscura]|uniref:uncharacterized protein LOC111079082 n=1 Tax=Drosophila obscura TaxID=7282 RepID=UPI000BA182B9|nr:uncharacterized protein LOC111079082 [Drosophila obscura]